MMKTFNIFLDCVSSIQCSYCSVYQVEGLNALEAFWKSELCIVSFEKECLASGFYQFFIFICLFKTRYQVA